MIKKDLQASADGCAKIGKGMMGCGCLLMLLPLLALLLIIAAAAVSS